MSDWFPYVGIAVGRFASGQEEVVGCCEYGKEPSGFYKMGELFDWPHTLLVNCVKKLQEKLN
jgi:hypothetical protein